MRKSVLKPKKRRFTLRKYENQPFRAKKQIFRNSVFSKSTIRPIPTHVNVDEIVAAGRLLLLVGVHAVEDRAADGGRGRGGGGSMRLLDGEGNNCEADFGY